MGPRPGEAVLAVCAWLACACLAAAAEPAAVKPAVPDVPVDVLALLKNRCVKCHGPAKQEGRLNLSLPSGIQRGGENGPVVVPGKPDASPLWQLVEADEMPKDEPLGAEEKAVLEKWIAAGAAGLPATVAAVADGDEHWAFGRLDPPVAPAVRDASRVRTPLDAFVESRLEAAGLTLGPEADRRTLIRRVSFDLTGLPPTLAEIDAFLADNGEQAYESMVDRYLASPAYGERWGKYWLDAAGYADSNGYFSADTDRPLAWRYRDYVIRSIAADKPFDRFVREQLSGDELAGYRPGSDITAETIELLTATHYLRNSPDGTDSSDGNEDEVRADKYAVLEGTLQIIGSSLLGMTVQCARCHDHKFEPFSQRDYYQLQAILYPAFNVDKWVKPKDRETSAATAAELTAYRENLQQIDAAIASRQREFRDWLQQNRGPARKLLGEDFDGERKLSEVWSNTVAGDTVSAGQPAVNIDSAAAPGAEAKGGVLKIIESGQSGDRTLATRQTIDWTPDAAGGWVQVTFDLVKGAPYVAYFVALRDFNDAGPTPGGNVLIDGAAKGTAAVYVDYPGADSRGVGTIGASGYTAGRNFGVRITHVGDDKFDLAHLVDGVPEAGVVTLSAADLPDGGFGFEYCCGRSFSVDNVLIEASDGRLEDPAARAKRVAELRQKRDEHDAAIKELQKRRPTEPGKLAAVTDLAAEAPEVFLLERGIYKARGEKVEPRAPAVLSEMSNQADVLSQSAKIEGSTGRRAAFARWLTASDSRAAARLARVTVNRWWQHHFGVGLVATTDNLGYSGAPATHPELLEYLAAELVNSGWSAKAVHRLILRSAVYRQSSAPRAEGTARDADNHLLWRYPLRRLDAEAIRDAMLSISGELDPQAGGPYVPTKRTAEGDVIVDEADVGARRRSVYLQQRRTDVASLLEVFDAPSIVVNCTQRMPTTQPLQSLGLLNSRFARLRAAAFAKRIALEAGDETAARIERAFLIAYGRPPAPAERIAATSFIAAQPAEYPGQADAVEKSWTDFCNMLLASNAFLYVE